VIAKRLDHAQGPRVVETGDQHDRSLAEIRQRSGLRCLQARGVAMITEKFGHAEQGVRIGKVDMVAIVNVVGDAEVRGQLAVDRR
jgi:hypothetical protein